jgi:hypothetical protein
MDSFDGYDTYAVDEKRYVRFNNAAFVSNYKRNDLLTTTMTLYCIPVGDFERTRFDFIEEIGKMERLISAANQPKTLADIYPREMQNVGTPEKAEETSTPKDAVTLYDVLYACVTAEHQMEDKRKYHIIIGSKAYFDSNLPSFSEDDEVDMFWELVKLSDTAKQNRLIFDQYASILIVKKR